MSATHGISAAILTDLPLPLVATGGLPVAAQWLVLDPAAGGFAMTPRCEFRVP